MTVPAHDARDADDGHVEEQADRIDQNLRSL